MSWEQPGLYDALATASSPRLGSVTEELLPPGIPFTFSDSTFHFSRFRLDQVAWTDPPMAPDGSTSIPPPTRVGFLLLRDERVFAAWGSPAPSRGTLDRFLANVVNASQGDRDALAAAMLANESTEAEVWLPLKLDQAFSDLVAEAGPPAETREGRRVTLEWTGWDFVLEVPARIATLPNDSSGWTATTEDDGLPYFKLYATPDDRVTLFHGEGNSRSGFTVQDAMVWANETLATAGLPPATYQKWQADYATCM